MTVCTESNKHTEQEEAIEEDIENVSTEKLIENVQSSNFLIVNLTSKRQTNS
jgi:predicted peroxiredoxin